MSGDGTLLVPPPFWHNKRPDKGYPQDCPDCGRRNIQGATPAWMSGTGQPWTNTCCGMEADGLRDSYMVSIGGLSPSCDRWWTGYTGSVGETPNSFHENPYGNDPAYLTPRMPWANFPEICPKAYDMLKEIDGVYRVERLESAANCSYSFQESWAEYGDLFFVPRPYLNSTTGDWGTNAAWGWYKNVTLTCRSGWWEVRAQISARHRIVRSAGYLRIPDPDHLADFLAVTPTDMPTYSPPPSSDSYRDISVAYETATAEIDETWTSQPNYDPANLRYHRIRLDPAAISYANPDYWRRMSGVHHFWERDISANVLCMTVRSKDLYSSWMGNNCHRGGTARVG